MYDISTRTGKIVHEHAEVVVASQVRDSPPIPRLELSEDLLDRALVGWERFVSSFEGSLDD
ncbi:hypothetical protein ACIQZO_33305 [Streptomyces sp. NPDC097617]|uniref:hypothetical protein n=1 Tax=Streptomyces sp. NPDC097617 TaxID=3366091 RepID=UPI0037FBB5AD